MRDELEELNQIEKKLKELHKEFILMKAVYYKHKGETWAAIEKRLMKEAKPLGLRWGTIYKNAFRMLQGA